MFKLTRVNRIKDNGIKHLLDKKKKKHAFFFSKLFYCSTVWSSTSKKNVLHFTKLSDYTPNLPHLDYRTFPHLIRMFKRNLFKESQEYLSKSLSKDKFDSSAGNKWSLYSEMKNEVRFESYLDLIKNVKTRVAVTKMRISCHLLPIESGRYKKIPRVERLCPLCNRSEIGDEFHYFLKCTHSSLFSYEGYLLGEPILDKQ